MHKNTNKYGQSLYEVILSVGIFSLVLVALVSLTVKAISNSTYSRNQSLSARYNQELLEWLRSERDQDWTVFKNNVTANTTYCFNQLNYTNPGACDLANSADQISGTIFFRQATFTHDAGPPEKITVESTVTWQDSSGTHTSKANTSFTNWKKNY